MERVNVMECDCGSLRGLFQVQGWLRTRRGGSGYPFPGRWVNDGGDDDAVSWQDGNILGPTVAFNGTTETLTKQPLADIGLPGGNPQILCLFGVRAV